MREMVNHFRAPPPSWRNVQVFLYWGPTGSGKSRTVYEKYPELYKKDDTEWWEGYTDQTVIFFEEFYGQHKIASMLKWLDGYPERLQVKGTSAMSYWTTVIIASNVHRDQWWAHATQAIPFAVRAALERRLPNDHCFELQVAPPPAPLPMQVHPNRMAERFTQLEDDATSNHGTG